MNTLHFNFAKDMQMWIGAEVTTDYEPTCFLLRFAALFQWMWNQVAAQGSPLTPARFKSAWEGRVDAKLVASWGTFVSCELKTGLLPLLLEEFAILLRHKKRDHLTSIADLYDVLIGDKFKQWLKTYAMSLSSKDSFKLSRRDHNVSTLCHIVRCLFTALRDRILATVPVDELSLCSAVRMRDLPRVILDSPTTGVFNGLQMHIDPPMAALGSRPAKTENVVREVLLQGRLAVLQGRADAYVKQLVTEWAIKEAGGRKGPAGPMCPECEGELDLSSSFVSVRCKEASHCRTALHEYCMLSGVGGSLEPNEPQCPKCGGAVDLVWLKCGRKLVENQYNSGASLSAREAKALEGTEEEAADEGADEPEEEEEEERKHGADVIPRTIKISRNLHARIAAGGGADLNLDAKSRAAYKLEQAAVRDAKKIEQAQHAALRKERFTVEEARRKEKEAAEAVEAVLAEKKPRSGIAVVNKGDVAKIARKKDELTPLMAVQAELASNRDREGAGAGAGIKKNSHRNYGSEDGFQTVRSNYVDREERRMARQRTEVSLLRGPSASSSKAPLMTKSIPLPIAWSAPSPTTHDGMQIHVPTTVASPLASVLGWGAAREVESNSSAFPSLAASSGSDSTPPLSGSYVQPHMSAALKAAAREKQEKQEKQEALEREEAFKAAKAAAKKKRLAELQKKQKLLQIEEAQAAASALATVFVPLKTAVLNPSFAEHPEPSPSVSSFDSASSSSSASVYALSLLEEKKRLEFIEAQVEGKGERERERSHTPLNAAIGLANHAQPGASPSLPSAIVYTSATALTTSAARDVQLVESVRTFTPNAGESLTLLVTGINDCRHLVTGHLIGSLCQTFGGVKVRQVMSMHPAQGFCIIVMFERVESARAAYHSLHRMVVELEGSPGFQPRECTLCLAFVAPTHTGVIDVRMAPTITARLKGQRTSESMLHSHSPFQPPGGMAHFV